ncbi:MAG: zinc ribbon domain-containing protein [Chloroflexota bacterium]|nr:zinc ribbon domain-containing protein [Chloroflexota bacterium]
MGILETLFQGATVFVALAGAYLVAFWFVLIVWTYRDIEARSRSVVTQVFSTLMVMLFFVPGVLLYLILRPKETLDQAFQRSLEEEYLLQDLEELPLCPSCHRYVEDDFVLCPHCHAQLREACPSCARLVDLRWAMCPYCATVQDGHGERIERVEAPAARWTAPNLRRRRILEPSERSEPAVATVAASEAPVGAGSGVNGSVRTTEGRSDAQPQSLPFTILSGMRSVVRQPERVRPGGTDHVGGASNGHAKGGGVVAGPSNGQGAGHETIESFTTNGNGANGHHPSRIDGDGPGVERDTDPAAVSTRTTSSR